MYYFINKFRLLFLILIIQSVSINAQQLVHQSEKNWKLHFGFLGGATVASYMNNLINTEYDFLPEGKTDYEINYAPRPTVNLGVFSEVEFCEKFSHRMTVNYTMKAIPAPIFLNSNSSTNFNNYQSIFLNGLNVSGTLIFKPINKFKIGLGLNYSHFFINKDLANSNYGSYTNTLMTCKGIHLETIYSTGPRTDIALVVTAANSQVRKMQIDNIMIGVNVYHKICGKEVRIKKEIYKIDYSKVN
ncbi:hypothetical protein OAK19_02245 [Aureispira]|nr:hypothetical protein [Aureispira sp.]